MPQGDADINMLFEQYDPLTAASVSSGSSSEESEDEEDVVHRVCTFEISSQVYSLLNIFIDDG